MKNRICLRAFAKINLGLNILDRRPDGYHSIRTVYQTVALHDRLDPLPGYPEYAEIEFINLEVRKNFEETWFWLEEARGLF